MLFRSDVGKPKSYVYQDEKHTYHGHEYDGIEVIENIAIRLKFDNYSKEAIKVTCQHHMIFHKL